MPRLLGPLIALAGLWYLAGCGETKKTGGGANLKDPLTDLGAMLKALAEERRKPPAKLAELEAVEPLIPLAGPLVRSGDIVYLWGAEYAQGSKRWWPRKESLQPMADGFSYRRDSEGDDRR